MLSPLLFLTVGAAAASAGLQGHDSNGLLAGGGGGEGGHGRVAPLPTPHGLCSRNSGETCQFAMMISQTFTLK
jgi:hypothetical protein